MGCQWQLQLLTMRVTVTECAGLGAALRGAVHGGSRPFTGFHGLFTGFHGLFTAGGVQVHGGARWFTA